jgi:sulfur-carrier protein
MPITVVLPRALQAYAQDSDALLLQQPCATVDDALRAVGERWPALLDRVLTEQGEVREHVNIFVGEDSIRFANGLATPVAEGDTLMIVAAVSGG